MFHTEHEIKNVLQYAEKYCSFKVKVNQNAAAH